MNHPKCPSCGTDLAPPNDSTIVAVCPSCRRVIPGPHAVLGRQPVVECGAATPALFIDDLARPET